MRLPSSDLAGRFVRAGTIAITLVVFAWIVTVMVFQTTIEYPHDTIAAVYHNSASSIMSQRFLSPQIIAVVAIKTNTPGNIIEKIYYFISALTVMVIMWFWLNEFRFDRRGRMFGVLLTAFSFVVGFAYSQPFRDKGLRFSFDIVSVAFIGGMLILISRKKIAMFYLVLVVAMLNRETAGTVVPFVFMRFYRESLWKATIFTGVGFAIAATIKVLLIASLGSIDEVFDFVLPGSLYFLFEGESKMVIWGRFCTIVGGAWALVFSGLIGASEEIKRLVPSLVLAFVALLCCAGIAEMRAWFDLVPFAVSVAVSALDRADSRFVSFLEKSS